MQNRRQPRHRPSLVIGRITRRKPVMDARECLPEKGKIRLGGVQMLGPATERRRIGRPIRVLERRRRLFPRVVLHKAPPQCLTASQQAVLGVRERKQRQEGEGLSATVAATAPDLDPIMVFIVCLFAAVSMADNRIAFTSGASPQDDFGAARGPIRFTLVRRDRKWDKQNRPIRVNVKRKISPVGSMPTPFLVSAFSPTCFERAHSIRESVVFLCSLETFFSSPLWFHVLVVTTPFGLLKLTSRCRLSALNRR